MSSDCLLFELMYLGVKVNGIQTIENLILNLNNNK